MRYIAYFKNSEIVYQEPSSLDDEQIIDFDEFLRRAGIIGPNEEVASVESVE